MLRLGVGIGNGKGFSAQAALRPWSGALEVSLAESRAVSLASSIRGGQPSLISSTVPSVPRGGLLKLQKMEIVVLQDS